MTEELQTAMKAAGLRDVILCECMNGSMTAQFDGMFDHAVMRPFLQARDLEFTVAAAGCVTFSAVTNIGTLPHPDAIDSGDPVIVDSGPIRQTQHKNTAVTSTTLDEVLRGPSVFKISVGQNRIHVDELKPSVVKNGLAHMNRRGIIKSQKRRCVWPATSATQRRAATARQKSRSWSAAVFGR